MFLCNHGHEVFAYMNIGYIYCQEMVLFILFSCRLHTKTHYNMTPHPIVHSPKTSYYVLLC